ncbi:MAG: TonB-dependent receptor [Gammaproteobacteria bacterium]|nr:TonB-dependent receptor [Gammaproteobacteria bacterium]
MDVGKGAPRTGHMSPTERVSTMRHAFFLASALIGPSMVFGGAPAWTEESQIEEITVTARKVEENLNEVPVSVSAFTDATMEGLDINSISDMARFAPGLSFSSAFGRATERPVIRGQGNILAGVQFGVESGVAYFVDGMYYAGDIQSLDMTNLDRVEVIRGPQSALYGRNTYSGAINFVTKRVEDDLGGGFRVRALGSGEREMVGHLDAPIVEGVLGLRAAVRHYDFAGQWTNRVTEQDIGQEQTTSINLTLDWAPTDAWSIVARIQSQSDEDGTRPFFLQSATSNNCYPGYRSLAYWPRVESDNSNQYYCGEIEVGPIQLNDGADADGMPNVLPGIGPDSICANTACLPFLPPFGPLYGLERGVVFSGVERDLNVLALSAEYEAGSGHVFTFQTSYRDEERKTGSDSDHGPTNFFLGPEAFFALSEVSEYTENTLEFRWNSPAESRVRYSAGVFYYDYEQDVSDLVVGGTTEDGTDNFVTNLAAFGALAWDISERLGATLEMRYADEEKQQEDRDAAGMIEFGGAKTFTSIAPRLTLDYAVRDDMLLYGTYSDGIKPGGLNGATGVAVGRASYEEEQSRNFEGGIKTAAMGGRLQLNVALFFTDIESYQLTTPVASPSGALNSVVTNQADGKVRGVELEALARVSDTLRIGFNYALADSEFTSGCDEFQWTLTSGGGKFTGDPATSLNPNGRGDCSVAGHQFPMGSRHQLGMWLDWNLRQAAGREWFANFNMSHESKRYTQLHQASYTGAATLLGLRMGIRGERWTAALIGRNLTDEDSAILATRWLQSPLLNRFTSVNSAPAGADTGMPRAFFALPRRGRQIGIELSYRL